MNCRELEDAVDREPHPMTDNTEAKAQLVALQSMAGLAGEIAGRLREETEAGCSPWLWSWLERFDAVNQKVQIGR